MRTFFGYLPDPPGHRYNRFHLHPAFRAALVDDSSIDEFAPPCWDQRAASACVGLGTAGAITTGFASHGMPLPSAASGSFLYRLARAVDREPVAGKLPPLEDRGAEPNQLVRAVSVWGVPLESEVDGGRTALSPDYSDHLEAHIDDEPTLDELLAADERLVVGFNAITEEGDERVLRVCQALSDRYPVMAGVSAGNAVFQGYDGRGLLGPTGDRPDHWIYLTAHRTVEGRKNVRLRNSWGLGWGDGGSAWCSEDFIRRGLWNILVADLGL